MQPKYQRISIESKLDNNKDILAVRFPSRRFIKQNKIINDILLGKGYTYKGNKVWYPKELWIYNPMKN
mgnify:CR=1 FL=1